MRGMKKRYVLLAILMILVFLGVVRACSCSLFKSTGTNTDTVPRLSFVERREGDQIFSYVHIEVPAFPGCVSEIQCYEDQFGNGKGELMRDGSLILRHAWGNIKLTAHLIPVPGAVIFNVFLQAPTKEEVKSVGTISPCWQLTKAGGVERGDFIEDFVNNCFIYTVNGFTFFKDTIRFKDTTYIPNAVPLPDDDPGVLHPPVQVYVPAWEMLQNLPAQGWGNSTARPIYSLIGFASPDRTYLSAWGWGKSFNLAQGAVHCLHINPDLWHDHGEINGGVLFRGKMYFMENDPDRLLARYLGDFPQDWQTEISLKPTGTHTLRVEHHGLKEESLHLHVGVQLDGKELQGGRDGWRKHPWGAFTREGKEAEGRYKIWAWPFEDFVEVYLAVENNKKLEAKAEMITEITGSDMEGGIPGPWIAGAVWEKKSVRLQPGARKTFRGRLFLLEKGKKNGLFLREWFSSETRENSTTKGMQTQLNKRMEKALAEWRLSQPFALPLP